MDILNATPEQVADYEAYLARHGLLATKTPVELAWTRLRAGSYTASPGRHDYSIYRVYSTPGYTNNEYPWRVIHADHHGDHEVVEVTRTLAQAKRAANANFNSYFDHAR